MTNGTKTILMMLGLGFIAGMAAVAVSVRTRFGRKVSGLSA